MINLLIAVFSHTFTHLQDNADQIWKFQRFKLVEEYDDFPIFSPPLNLIVYVVSTVKYLTRRKVIKNLKKKRQPIPIDEIEMNQEFESERIINEIKALERKYSDTYLRNRLKQEKETMENMLREALERFVPHV